MQKPVKSSSITLKHVIFWAGSIALVFSLILFVLEKTRVTNFYTKPIIGITNNTRPPNTVDYTPATTGEKPSNDQKSQDTNTTAQNQTTSKVTVILNAAGQDAKGGPVIIKAQISGINGGACVATLTAGSTTKTYNANIVWNGSFYTCDGFSIPFTDLTLGTWQLVLVASQNNSSGSANQQINIEAQ